MFKNHKKKANQSNEKDDDVQQLQLDHILDGVIH